MTIQERFEAMRKAGLELPRPLELLGGLDGKAALAHLDARQAVYGPGVLESKQKALVGLSAAVALDAPACIETNLKTARKSGATKAEIMETIAIAKFSKQSTVVGNSAAALEWLAAQPGD